MNNEERILAMLEQLTRDVSGLKDGQAQLEQKLDTLDRKVDALDKKVDVLDKKVDVIFEQTANLTEFKTEITEKVDDILAVTKVNTFDITRLRAAR